MSLFETFEISGSAMNAQSVRLNTVASNMANADTVSGDPNTVYKARQPVFSTLLKNAGLQQDMAGVKINGVIESNAPPIKRYEPNHPMADAQGNIYLPNVNMVEEMANMMSASRSYQNNVEVFNTTKQLLMRTLQLGR
ncbi:MAG: flagellar basal body rod protein FlgC [Gammaproteobacteria bacterium]|nr:flagellar basal body rod protein FlgC [Gammaproteobacteria bacterium]